MNWFALAPPVRLHAQANTQPATNGPDPTDVLRRARVRLLADAARMPRYTCEQQIVRHFYRTESEGSQSCAAILAKREHRKHDLELAFWDRLRLDVAIADNMEVHSWPGAAEFDEDEIRGLVSNGPFGSGDFATFIPGIFGQSAKVRFERQRMVNGETVLDYTFEVPQSGSHYEISTTAGNVITAYEGSFWLNPQSADLVQLAVRTAELPTGTTACQGISEIRYTRTQIHGQNVPIPEQASLDRLPEWSRGGGHNFVLQLSRIRDQEQVAFRRGGRHCQQHATVSDRIGNDRV